MFERISFTKVIHILHCFWTTPQCLYSLILFLYYTSSGHNKHFRLCFKWVFLSSWSSSMCRSVVKVLLQQKSKTNTLLNLKSNIAALAPPTLRHSSFPGAMARLTARMARMNEIARCGFLLSFSGTLIHYIISYTICRFIYDYMIYNRISSCAFSALQIILQHSAI